jgi:mannose-6-phosphate isomerase-like protein (cupin superfamily)
VSGAASASQDDEIASTAAAEFAKRQSSSAAKITHVPGERVAAGFRHDATLIEDPAFRVAASHRTGAGEAEVHLRDTDIFYVTEGSAELIVGGEVVSPRNVSPEEIRGSEIKGGEAIRLAQGDVMSVPRGTPHWFKQVRTPFNYYVVKSRR